MLDVIDMNTINNTQIQWKLILYIILKPDYYNN